VVDRGDRDEPDGVEQRIARAGSAIGSSFEELIARGQRGQRGEPTARAPAPPPSPAEGPADDRTWSGVQAISKKFSEEQKFIAAPWTEKDGKPFPSGKHVALTHWTGPENQQGITQYCALPSGAVVSKFTKDYPASNAPEPNAP